MTASNENHKLPVFPIGVTAEVLSVTPATLRIWEKKGLISPGRRGKDRYYSQQDLKRLKKIKYLLNNQGLNLAGVRNVLSQQNCWEIKKCGDKRLRCPVFTSDNDKLEVNESC